MIKIPSIKLPDKEEFEFKEKAFLLSVYEQWQNSSKAWFYALGAVILLSFPLAWILGNALASGFIRAYSPPAVFENPFTPQVIKILKVEALPVTKDIFSAYAQVFNPNTDYTAHKFKYRFRLLDSGGQLLSEVQGMSFIGAGESKFLLAPLVRVTDGGPLDAELVLEQVRWTKRVPQFDVDLEVLQKRSGVTTEGNFFVEGQLKSLQGFSVKKAELAVVVFDKTNQNVLAVNSSVIDDLKPLESRYFRLVWPSGVQYPAIGQIQVLPYIDLLSPGLILEEGAAVPSR